MYAIIDTNKDGIADSVITVVDNLAAPLGLAYANGSLWVATTPTIYRFDNVDELALAGQVTLCGLLQGQLKHPYSKHQPAIAVRVSQLALKTSCGHAELLNTNYNSAWSWYAKRSRQPLHDHRSRQHDLLQPWSPIQHWYTSSCGCGQPDICHHCQDDTQRNKSDHFCHRLVMCPLRSLLLKLILCRLDKVTPCV